MAFALLERRRPDETIAPALASVEMPRDDPSAVELAERIARCSVQAGPITDRPAGIPYRVSFRSLTSLVRFPRLSISGRLPVALANVGCTALFFGVLISSSRISTDRGILTCAGDVTMMAAVGTIGLLLFVGSFTVSRATLAARHPHPVAPDTTLRVAFVTTIVPDQEPLAVVRRTLGAAAELHWPGTVDLWLLDEGSADPRVARSVRAACRELGVRRHSRRGLPQFNTDGGSFAARTKHGNINSWLQRHGGRYDVLVAVDPDHRPLPNMLDRMLGYFHDPDVAFVVGPQEYGNFAENPVARRAQYQQHFFHGILQPAGNADGCAMHVGTNYAFRIDALNQVGGFQASITEDMATGLAVHKATNPATGRTWRSVYTPDVLAVGEGPASWTDYFTQQQRWSRGTIETWRHQFFPGARKLRPKVFWHYFLLMSYYPATAIAWLLGALNSVLYLGFGVASIHVSPSLWLVLYAWAFASQVAIFLVGRNHTVSPYEPAGSLGLTGLLMSILCTPIYVGSLVGAILRRPSRFVVTPKGHKVNPDRLRTFDRHLRWAAFFAVLLIVSVITGHANAAMRLWAAIPLAVCLLPVGFWWASLAAEYRTARRARAAAAAARSRIPTERAPAERTPAERTPAERTPAERTPAERAALKVVR